MDELESFYANLYDGSNCSLDSATSTFLDVSRGFPTLTDDLKMICEGKIGYSECFSVLGTFPKHKTPGNDGLTIEFYLAFPSMAYHRGQNSTFEFCLYVWHSML